MYGFQLYVTAVGGCEIHVLHNGVVADVRELACGNTLHVVEGIASPYFVVRDHTSSGWLVMQRTYLTGATQVDGDGFGILLLDGVIKAFQIQFLLLVALQSLGGIVGTDAVDAERTTSLVEAYTQLLGGNGLEAQQTFVTDSGCSLLDADGLPFAAVKVL